MAFRFAIMRDLVRAAVFIFTMPRATALSNIFPSFWESSSAPFTFFAVTALRNATRMECSSALAKELRTVRFAAWRRAFFAFALFGISELQITSVIVNIAWAKYSGILQNVKLLFNRWLFCLDSNKALSNGAV